MATFPYWQYFLALEADLASSGRYIEIVQDNFSAYSIEYARLILTAGSEIDVVCKLVCKELDPNNNCGNINEYRNLITSKCPLLYSTEVLVPRYGICRQPWRAWGGNSNPDWWRSYNNVKHERNLFYKEANLQNALDAVTGLFVIVLYLHQIQKSKDELEPNPQLCHLEQEPGYLMHEGDYVVPDFPR